MNGRTVKFWIRVNADVPRDPNVSRLAEALHLPSRHALGMVVAVWCAMAEHTKNGDLSNISDSTLEEWAGANTIRALKPGQFASYFVKIFLDEHRCAPDFRENQAKPMERSQRDRERMARNRHHRREQFANGSRTDGLGQRNGSALRNDTERNATELKEEKIGTAGSNPAMSSELVVSSLPEVSNVQVKTLLPALRERTKNGVIERLAQVTEELQMGTRVRLEKEQARKLGASVVFAYWFAKTGAGERTLLDDKREAALVKALHESGDNVGEMLYAVDGALRSEWHNGRKDGVKKYRVGHIFASREMIEELANKVPEYRRGEDHPMVGRYADALRGT